MDSVKAVTATFSSSSLTISASTLGNGSIQPSGIILVDYGSPQLFSIVPDIGFHIEELRVDGIKVDPERSYTFNNVTTSHTISVEFSADIPGDVTADNFIELDDAITALKVTSGQDSPFIRAIGDINRDDRLGIAEVIYILEVVGGYYRSE
jgi:hypothetical protein